MDVEESIVESEDGDEGVEAEAERQLRVSLNARSGAVALKHGSQF